MNVGPGLRKVGSVAAVLLMGIVAVLWWADWLLGPWLIQRTPADNEYSAQEVAATDGWVSCSQYRDWYLTKISGPCRGFVAPAKIAVGQHFTVAGVEYEIHIILATHIQADSETFKKGNWYCEAAQSESDLDHTGRQWRRVWLLVPRCQPVR